MKIHLLTVADTNDANIGLGCGEDANCIYGFFGQGAQLLDVPLEATTVQGDLFRRDVVQGELDHIQPDSDDVVVFYYSGHGFRTESKQERWPYLAFSESQFDPIKGLAADKILAMLKGGRPRLVIVISDCCNSFMEDYYVDVETYTRSETTTERARKNFEQLLKHARGTILATSSEPGELSLGTCQGGLYTMSLLRAAESQVWRQDDVTWESIFREGSMRHKVPNNRSGFQTPIYHLELGSSVRSWTQRGRRRPGQQQLDSDLEVRSVTPTQRSNWAPWAWLSLAITAIILGGIFTGYRNYAIDTAAALVVLFCGWRGYQLGVLEGLGHLTKWFGPWLAAVWLQAPTDAWVHDMTGWSHISRTYVVFGLIVLITFGLTRAVLRRIADGHASSQIDALLGFLFAAILGSGICLIAGFLLIHLGWMTADQTQLLELSEALLSGLNILPDSR